MVSFGTAFGLFAVIGSAFGYFITPVGVKLGIGTFINLKESGMLFPTYMSPPFPSEATYYIYNVKNPKEALKGAKLNLGLKGPFYYDAYIKRSEIAFAMGGEVVKYHSRRELHLDEKRSANLEERFWILNPILIMTSKTVRTLVLDRVPFQSLSEPIVFNTVNVLLDTYKERLFVKRSPRILLEGRKIDLLIMVESLADRFGVKFLLPPGPPDNTFGIAHFQNNTVDIMEIYTGVGNTKHKFGEVYKWRNKEAMNIWSGKCNEIGGTNGEVYKPFIENGKPIKVFVAQLCRTFFLDPVSPEPVEVQNGLKALEYEISPRLYLGARNNPGNKCFCKDTRTYDCQYDGFIPMGPCFFEAPLFFTRTNFKGVDRRIRSLLDERTFDATLPDKQSFYLEPTSGAVLRANLTLTAVFKFHRQRYMRDLTNVQNLTYAPLFVASEAVAVPLSLTFPLIGLQYMLEYYKPFYIVSGLFGCCVLIFKFIKFLT